MSQQENLVWIDLEMTGLSPEQDTIIEIATIVTNSDLEILAEGPVFAIYQPQQIMQAMDEWNTRQHGQSGLTERVRLSQTNMQQAEQETIQFLSQYVAPAQSPMCGNSICQDRRFLAKYMPHLESFFHYRNLDVSSVKELAKRWRPDILAGVNKKGAHLALDDIKDSIAELAHYRRYFFNDKKVE